MVFVVCLSSVTFVHPTQTVKLFNNIFTRFCTLGIWEGPCKVSKDRPKGTHPPGALNTRGVGETRSIRASLAASHYCINHPYTASLLSTTDQYFI